MKKLKKLTAIWMMLTLILLLSVPALAAGDCSITLTNDKEGHTYEAYQIFTGDLSDGVLSNIEWGSGVNGPALLAALQAADAGKYGACETAADVATALGGDEGTATAADAAAFAEVAAGYLTSASGTSSAPLEG